MDAVFFIHIGHNLEVHMDNMIVKALEGNSHATDLEDILWLVNNYNICLNLAKCLFDLQEGRFLDFKLTKRGMEVNPNKFQVIVDMRSPSNVKEVQQLTSRSTTLSRFVSCACDKAFHFLDMLKKM